MKAKFFLYSLALVLSLGIAATLSQTFAQMGVDNGQGPVTDTAPGTGAVIDNSNEGNAMDTNTAAYNLIWLLPLIIIPLMVYLLWPKDRDEYDTGYSGYAGAKGGKSSRYDEDEKSEVR